MAQVVDRLVGRSERRVYEAASIADEPNRKVGVPHVETHLFVRAASDEGGNRIRVDDVTLGCEPGAHADHVGFADPFHEEAVGKLPTHLIESAYSEIRAHEDDSIVVLRKLVDHVDTGFSHGSVRFDGVDHGLGFGLVDRAQVVPFVVAFGFWDALSLHGVADQCARSVFFIG